MFYCSLTWSKYYLCIYYNSNFVTTLCIEQYPKSNKMKVQNNVLKHSIPMPFKWYTLCHSNSQSVLKYHTETSTWNHYCTKFTVATVYVILVKVKYQNENQKYIFLRHFRLLVSQFLMMNIASFGLESTQSAALSITPCSIMVTCKFV